MSKPIISEKISDSERKSLLEDNLREEALKAVRMINNAEKALKRSIELDALSIKRLKAARTYFLGGCVLFSAVFLIFAFSLF